jgi:hypothetical protein
MKIKTTLSTGLIATGLMFCLSSQPALGLVTVSVQPTNQAVTVGSTAVFTANVIANSGEQITGYTWLTSPDGKNPFTTVAGATTATCTLTGVQTNATGYYFVNVTYNSSTASNQISVSSAVKLTVYDQARIITQPQSVGILMSGTNASFSVGALGTDLKYQWRLNRSGLVDNGRITGATNLDLILNALVPADSGSYDVVVTNLYSAVTSQVATISVYDPVGISVQPSNTTSIAGSNTQFSVIVTGTDPLSYQWQHAGTNLSNAGRFSGAKSSLLTITGTTIGDAGNYLVTITNPVSAMTSSVATLTVLVAPKITSATKATGRQGAFFSFTNTATGTAPITFGADGLPSGLSLQPTNGVISGIPLVTGVFNITIYATNSALTTTGQLVLTLTTGIPGINSALTASGKQGQTFRYTITASNVPSLFSASTLPSGLSFNPTTGVISGPPIVSGVFPITIGASNQFGGDSKVLTITIASSLPVITSALTAAGTEGDTNFSYTITASNSPTDFGASNLPLGLSLNPTNGIISGTPWYGGTFTVPIWANNPWGTGSAILVITIAYSPLSSLTIADVTPTWSKPYLLDFSFSLRDGTNPVVRPPNLLQVVCLEDGVPIPTEAPLVLESVMGTGSKQLKTFLVLDYTYSMFASPGAIDAMQAAAELLIDQEPAHALFGVIEFNADYMVPQFVTNKLTSTNNYFINDKTVLHQSIDGIQTNYVKGNYAGTRCWDAMYAALKQFGTNNVDEQRYLVAMTDGNDDSSDLNTLFFPTTAVDILIQTAQTNHVAIYCVAFGNNINVNALQQLTSQTGGHYYTAATTEDLGTQFQIIQKDISSQYVLRWATLKRAAVPAFPVPGFQPSFQIFCDGASNSWNTDIIPTNVTIIDDTQDPPVTNKFTTNAVVFPYNPPDWAGDVRVGSLRLVQDADVGPQAIRLRAAYTPRFVRELRLNYRPNFPCTASLDSTNTSEILSGWTMTETADTNGLRTLTLSSSDTNNLLTSIPYAAFGDLLSFNFQYPESLTATQAFSVFSVDNSIYTNYLPSGTIFTNQNFTNFIKLYPPPPPHGTPIPWLLYYGFTNNFAQAELFTTNGMPAWQDYLAGLNPTNVNSRFDVTIGYLPSQAPQILFSTVLARTYRVETSVSLGNWIVLRDNIPGTGGNILFIDNRTLSGVNTTYYRVAAY